MKSLNLLLSQSALHYQIVKGRSIVKEYDYATTEEQPELPLQSILEDLLKEEYTHIKVYSALNRFSMMPEGFKEHELGHALVNFNATPRQGEELMLAVSKKFGLQFYYTFPEALYQKIKSSKARVSFTFSGEKLLSLLSTKGHSEVHINLYHNQCEFVALRDKKVLLYNNLDVNSEVDFLYFILFTLSKLDFSLPTTRFYVYGETSKNQTFISELDKFSSHLKILYDNIPGKHFILQN